MSRSYWSALALSLLFTALACTLTRASSDDLPTAGGQKVLPPLQATLTLLGPAAAEGDVGVAFTFVPMQPAEHAISHMSADGVVSMAQPQDSEWLQLPANQPVTIQTTVHLDADGEGEVRGWVDVVDPQGSVLYGRSASLYVLIANQEVLTGSSSPIDLRLELLQRQRDSGAISAEDYDRELDRVLTGGATETN
jgi:hypothetical protein